MRIAFLGGFGHHYLRGALSDSAVGDVEKPVAFARASALDDRAVQLAAGLADVRFYEDATTMLDEYRPDVLSVGAEYGRNGDFVAMALERDIRVVSDKPIAATWAQLERIRALTTGTSRIVLTEFDFRSRGEFRAAREVVCAGRVGTPILASAQKSYRFARRPSWYADRELYAGTMMWIASHGIDVMRFALESPIVAVTGRHGNVARPEFGSMEDHCAALLQFESGATGIVHADYSRPDRSPQHGDDRLRIAGRDGIVEVRGGRCVLLGADGQERDVTASVAARPVYVELLAALRGESIDLYSTCASLETAAILLHTRDAADRQTWIRCV